jgi:hypothetical protein
LGYSCADAPGCFRVGLFEDIEAFAEASGVLVRDREDSDAALGAAGVADEVMAAALVGVGYCGVYDLDQVFGQGYLRREVTSGKRSSRDDVLLAETGEEVEEAVVGGLIVEKA